MDTTDALIQELGRTREHLNELLSAGPDSGPGHQETATRLAALLGAISTHLAPRDPWYLTVNGRQVGPFSYGFEAMHYAGRNYGLQVGEMDDLLVDGYFSKPGHEIRIDQHYTAR